MYLVLEPCFTLDAVDLEDFFFYFQSIMQVNMYLSSCRFLQRSLVCVNPVRAAAVSALLL